MWARDIELMLGCWLLVSPFVFAHAPDRLFLWANDLGCGAVAVVTALVCYWPPLRRAHLLLLAVAAWLVVFGWTSRLGAASENHITLGFLLGLFAIVPSEATLPPSAWRRFQGSAGGRGAP